MCRCVYVCVHVYVHNLFPSLCQRLFKQARGYNLFRHFIVVWEQLRRTFETFALDCNSVAIPELTLESTKLMQVLTSDDVHAQEDAISFILKSRLLELQNDFVTDAALQSLRDIGEFA